MRQSTGGSTIAAVPLVRAAAQLERSYNATMRLVLIGELRGWQDERGHWQVDAADLKRLANKRQAAITPPTQPTAA